MMPEPIRRALPLSAALALLAAFACSSSGGSGSNGGAGPQGPPGPQGPAGTSVAPSLIGVTPRVLLLDREVDVVIAGNATSFMGNEMSDFGPGVTVSSVAAQSATALSAHLKVDKAAQVGPRDLHVGSLTATGAFTISPAIDISVLNGTPQQGSVVLLDVFDRDPYNGFPVFGNVFGSGLFGFPPDPGITLIPPVYSSPTENRLEMLFAPMAAAGPVQLVGEDIVYNPSNPSQPEEGNVVVTYEGAPGAVTVAARTPTTLAADTPTTGNLANPFDTDLYHLTTDGTAQMVNVTVAPAGDAGSFVPELFLFGGGGLAADYLAMPWVPFSNTASDLYLIAANVRSSGVPYAITAAKVSAMLMAEQSSPHATQATAQPLGTYASPLVVAGSLAAAGEIDWYTFTGAGVRNLFVSVTGKIDGLTISVTDTTGFNSCGGFAKNPQNPFAPASGAGCELSCGNCALNFNLTISGNAAGAYTVGIEILP